MLHLALLGLAFWHDTAISGCRPDSFALKQALGTSSIAPQNSSSRFFRASAYAAAGCLDKALAELDLSRAALKDEGADKPLFKTKERNTRALYSYIRALQRIDNGERQAAITELLDLLEQNRSTEVMWRTTMKLGELLGSAKEDSAAWDRFDSILATLTAESFESWQLDLFRGLNAIRLGKGAAAIDGINKRLSQDLPEYRHYSLQVVLIELLVADGRFENARVYCNWSGTSIGAYLIVLEQRFRYLKACRTAWGKAISLPGDRASRATRVFDEAILSIEPDL
ncbi:hypothetical protein BAU06_19230 [Bordetella bronchialis]|uniref:Uncharacterized protein n=2 Tax=Bordetella bronchialis TaxID=463025 RepID=A0ABM6CVH4_9BORD|nr:hypothetical protein BAU06_19230 [Bordetella bronchialis]